MALEWRFSVLTPYVINMISTDPVVSPLVDAVHYGDQDKIGSGNIVCVEPDTRARQLNGVPRKTLVDLDMYVFVYVAKLQSAIQNRKEADLLIEAIETALHSDDTLGGQVIHTMVTASQSGFVNKSGTILRASRLTFNIRSQQFLGQ